MREDICYEVINCINSNKSASLDDKFFELNYMIVEHTKSVNITEDEKQFIRNYVETQRGVKQEEGCEIHSTDDHDSKWYTNLNSDSKLYARYEKYLSKSDFPLDVIETIGRDTDKIINQLGNTTLEGEWIRKGMVVGHVQSGKTANFVGVINKACDAGYKLIIVLAGMTESLRNQTQERVESGVVGRSSNQIIGLDLKKADPIGVGEIDIPGLDSLPVECRTSLEMDFKKDQNHGLTKLVNLNVPCILVVKKNTSILKNIREWIDQQIDFPNHKLKNTPCLILDDESDQASINTKDISEEEDRTAINEHINKMVGMFEKCTYLAYTATPFANVFIDNNSFNDIFPENFIINIEAPSNYFGAHKIFHEQFSKDYIRRNEDLKYCLPMNHKKDIEITNIPDSLIHAINLFILSKVIRKHKMQAKKHHSMLVHISRFNDVQRKLYHVIDDHITKLRAALRGNASLEKSVALKNSYMKSLFDSWEVEYSVSFQDWSLIQSGLYDAIEGICVEEVNGRDPKKVKDQLNYRIYKDGYSVIAVGGNKLSRGLTIEGLCISYFYRSTAMYDTLMQMGRWFGYRIGYEELCRVFMPEETESYFSHIVDALDDLRSEFKDMEDKGKEPKDFGIAVMSHPGSLAITARNKMRSAQDFTHSVNYSAKLVETVRLLTDSDSLKKNINTIKSLFEDLKIYETNTFEYKGVPCELIKQFLNNFRTSELDPLASSRPLIQFIDQIKDEYPDWVVKIVSRNNKEPKPFGGLKVGPSIRGARHKDGVIIFDNSRVGDSSNEKFDIDDELISKAQKLSDSELIKRIENGKLKLKHSKTIASKYLRKFRKRPLLLIYLMEPNIKEPQDEKLPAKYYPAYGISFPKIFGDVKAVELKVTRKYIENLNLESQNDEE